jgi:hypothetical protein
MRTARSLKIKTATGIHQRQLWKLHACESGARRFTTATWHMPGIAWA